MKPIPDAVEEGRNDLQRGPPVRPMALGAEEGREAPGGRPGPVGLKKSGRGTRHRPASLDTERKSWG